MKQMTRIVCLLLSLLLLTGCAPQGDPTVSSTVPETPGTVVGSRTAERTEQTLSQIKALGESPDDNYRTWYEIFVYSFCDSDGDGIGDLAGVTSKLDYLQELGINGIWLMPIHPSTSYHKYNVSDYYAIDPAYGTMEDFETFMAECGKRDIHVILDLVVNHSGSEHAWFREAYAYLQQLGDGEPDVSECKYLDYYFFSKEAAPGYCQVEGTGWYYEAQFNYDMPDLNLASEALRSEITDIMAFWLDKGVSGFRMDAAKEFYSGNPEKNKEVLAWIQETALSLKPDVYLVAEAWLDFASLTDYYESGFMSLFNFAFANSEGKIVKVLRSAGNASTVSSYATALEKADTAYLGSNPDYIDAPFLSNHDVGRIIGFVSRDITKTKLAGAMNIFMSGSCFIYYGEELGMVGSGNDPSKRAPMYWNTARDNGTTGLPPECELPEEYPCGSLEEQLFDDASVYNYYRQAIAIRNALPVISHGRTTAEAALNIGCVSAQRKTWGEESCIILMNIQDAAAQVDLMDYADWTLAASLQTGEDAVTLEGTVLNMPAYGVAVLIPNP